MKLIFAVSDVSLTMGPTRCYKTEVFLHLYLQFLYIFYAISIRYTRLRWRKCIWIPNFDEISQSTAEIQLLPVSENGRPPYQNFASDFDFDLCVVIGMWFCFCLPNFVVIMAGLWRHIYFSRWRPWSQKSISGIRSKKVDIYLRTKFPWNISMHGWDKTTSGFAKRKAATLELNFRFLFWPMYSYRRVIVHPPAKFGATRRLLAK